jgi:Flp pilus assembly protein TadD
VRLLQRVLQTLSGRTSASTAQSAADAKFEGASAAIEGADWALAERLLDELTVSGAASAAVAQQRAVVYAAQGRYAEAERCFREALAIQPASTALLKNLALALCHQSRHREAIETLERACIIAPEEAQIHCDLGNLLYDQGEFDRARPAFERALALVPGHRESAIKLGFFDLLRGDVAAGWKGYRSAMRDALLAQNSGIAIDSALPAHLTGVRVLLLGEQGIGDELLFLRYAKRLKERGAKVYYRAESRLSEVLRSRSIGLDRILTLGEPLPQRDATLLIGDLPALLSGPDLPTPLPLAPRADRVASMRASLLACGPRPYIGVTWRAGASGTPADLPTALEKHVPIAELAKVLRRVPGTLVVLQRNPASGELEQFSRLLGRPLHDLSGATDDLEDLMALLALLDDYVAVSNTNVHLLASLQRRARVLIPRPADWRWLAAGSSPWFPGFATYRQNTDGDWTGALQDLERDLLEVHPAAT